MNLRVFIFVLPVHTNHDVEQASSTVYQRKEELKRKAVETELPYQTPCCWCCLWDEQPHVLPCKDGSPHQTSCWQTSLQPQRPEAPLYPWWLRPLSQQQLHDDWCCGTLDTMRQPRAPKWIKYDQRLQKIADDFESYTNVLDYLEAVGNMTMLK